MKLYNAEVTLKHSLNPEISSEFQCVVLAENDNEVNDKIVKKFGKQLVDFKVWYDNDIVLIERKIIESM